MIKKISGIFIAVLLSFGIAAASFANVSGSGTFTPVMPGTTYFGYMYGNYYYGAINDDGVYNYYYMSGEYPSYSGSGIYNGSSISGSHNAVNGQQTLSFNAVSHGVGKTTVADTDLFAFTSYSGILDGNIGYDYTFTGQKDVSDPDDHLNFNIQMEIYYRDDNDIYHYAYSDYRSDVPGYGTKIVSHRDSGTYAGQIRFDYQDFGSQNWQIRWDFMGNGQDTTSQSPAPAPEPATLLLIGLGLVGLAGVRKKFKN